MNNPEISFVNPWLLLLVLPCLVLLLLPLAHRKPGMKINLTGYNDPIPDPIRNYIFSRRKYTVFYTKVWYHRA